MCTQNHTVHYNVQHKSRCDVQALQRQALRFQSQRFQSRRGQSLRCQSQCDPGRYDMTAGHLPELTSSSHRCTRSHRTAGPRPSLGRGAHRLGQPAPSPDRRRVNLRSHTDTDRLGDSSHCDASHCDASQSGPGQFPRPVPNGSAITSQPSGARLCHLHNVQHKSRCDVQVHSTTFAFSTQSMRSRC